MIQIRCFRGQKSKEMKRMGDLAPMPALPKKKRAGIEPALQLSQVGSEGDVQGHFDDAAAADGVLDHAERVAGVIGN